jgi:DNA-binding MarR family transcriptional regulator
MSERLEDLAVSLFGELLTADQLARNRISKALPKGMELSHFSVLNHLAGVQDERTPAQLAKAFHITRGAMTNTLSKLEWAGHIHAAQVRGDQPIRPRCARCGGASRGAGDRRSGQSLGR